jgi:hypothetical protein
MSIFVLRRAIERLRDGLFDSVAIERLTVEEEGIKQRFCKGLDSLEKGKGEPLCICGSYGQGKSHTLTYLHRHALSLGYATSFVQLDLREIPFHLFSVVYRSLMEKLLLPEGESFAAAWKRWGSEHSYEILDGMPQRFRLILTAMLGTERSYWLEKALMGRNMRLTYLKKMLKSCKKSLTCRGNLPYVQMVQVLGRVLKEMGYKGLVLFFDEAESIAQGRLKSRARSYEILDQFVQNRGFLYPIFAFTDDFFDQVKRELYDDEKCPFPKNYAEAWSDLNIVRLQELSSVGWETLQNRLIQLYAEGYRIDLSGQMAEIKKRLQNLPAQETRFRLKALVNQLDVETQFLC